jgi:hypothetical protein
MRVGSTSPRSVHVSGFASFGLLTPRLSPLSASCSSRQRFASSFLQTSGRPENPCLPLTLPRVGRVEDLHLQVGAPCRAHKKKGPTPCEAGPSLRQLKIGSLGGGNWGSQDSRRKFSIRLPSCKLRAGSAGPAGNSAVAGVCRPGPTSFRIGIAQRLCNLARLCTKSRRLRLP